MPAEAAARWLVLSGSGAMLAACLLGVAMLVPLQHQDGRAKVRASLLSAHLDWIMLGLMEGLAAGLCALFDLQPAAWVIATMIFGAWANPLPYLFRAFGVDAFRFAGGPVQRLSASLGALSSLAIIVSWASLLVLAAQSEKRLW